MTVQGDWSNGTGSPQSDIERKGRTMRRNRCAKIVATLGPASSTKERIAELVRTGVDVFRFNFSHGTHEDHAAGSRS